MKNKINKSKKRKTFKQAVKVTVEVQNCFQEGKLAIKKNERIKVELSDPQLGGGSLFIDQCLISQGLYPNANRWDYAIDYNGEVFFFEVHSANSSEVSAVLNKLDWLKVWLLQKAPEINAIKAKSPFYWVQSNGYHILPNSRQERTVIQKGLKPVSRLVLK